MKAAHYLIFFAMACLLLSCEGSQTETLEEIVDLELEDPTKDIEEKAIAGESPLDQQERIILESDEEEVEELSETSPQLR